MRFLSINKVEPGTVLAKPLYGNQGVILLRENVVLTENILSRLKAMGYTGLYIEDEISEGIVIEDVVAEGLKLRTASRLEEIINGNGNIAEMFPMIQDIVSSIITNKDVELSMRNLWGHHEYTYLHCVNVAILAVSVGIKMNLPEDDLIYLGTAGMLHDIGKNKIPSSLLDKKGKLSDEEFGILKKHPEFGYDMLTSAQELNSVTRAGVLQHHERYDGSGYPRGLKGNEITLYARILAVADTYDAMTSDRAYRDAYAPSEAVEYLMGNGDQLYDNLVIDAFVKCVTIYPLGSCVELNNGVRAVVVMNYQDCVLRPLLRTIESKEMIDLKNDTRYLNLCITKLVI